MLAESLGVEQNVVSPTFIIHREYLVGETDGEDGNEGNDGNGNNAGSLNNSAGNDDNQSNSTKRYLHHIDLYRLESEKEVDEIVSNNLFGAKNIVLIEWYDKFENYLDEKFSKLNVGLVKIYFEHDTENTRNVEVAEIK